MPQGATIYNDVTIQGQLNCTTIGITGSAFVSDAMVTATAKIATTKMRHRFQKQYVQESATTVVSEARVIHVVRGTTATVMEYRAGSVVINAGAATITIDLLKNGTTILTAVITLNSSNTAYILAAAPSFTSTAAVVGDVFETKIVATAGGGTIGKGVFAQMTLDEDPS